MVFAILVATICYPVNAVHAGPQLGIKNVAVTKLIDAPTTKETLFVITTGEDTYHIIVDANITTIGNETFIDLSATLFNPENETITASVRTPDTLTDAPYYTNGPVTAYRLSLNSTQVFALEIKLVIVLVAAIILQVFAIILAIITVPVLYALKTLFFGGPFICASLPWVLLTLLQDKNPDGTINLYFPYLPLSVHVNLILQKQYFVASDLHWWKISEHKITFLGFTLLTWYEAHFYKTRTVQNPPIPPTAGFAWYPNQPFAGETVNFTSTSFAQQGATITTYQWGLGDGGQENASSFNHVYNNSGVYNVTLQVTDSNVPSLSSFVSHNVTVQNVTAAALRIIPIDLEVSVQTGKSANTDILVGETLNQTDLTNVTFQALDLTDYVDNWTISSGNITFSGNAITVTKGTYTNVTATFNAPLGSPIGWYSGNIAVTSANGGNETIFATLLVYGPPTANFTWSPLTPSVGEVVTFDASSTISGGGYIVDYEWNFADGQTASGLTAVHTYTSATTYLVTLNVTDSNGLWNATQQQVQVVQPHGPKADFTVSPETANVGQLVSFDATASQSGWNGTNQMPITKYSWDFGDGNKTDTTTPIIYHAFSGSGIYFPSLTVNASGATPETDAITHRVVVTSVPVGGYSISLTRHNTSMPSSVYLALLIMLSAVFTTVRRKTRKEKNN